MIEINELIGALGAYVPPTRPRRLYATENSSYKRVYMWAQVVCIGPRGYRRSGWRDGVPNSQ